MTNLSIWNLWSMRAAFVGLALLILLANLLPLQTVPRGWAGPDVLLCLGLAWSARRPEYAPIPLLAAVFLLADFVLSRPPGLGAALAVLACNDMQTRARRVRDAGFVAEWARAALLIVGVALAYRVALAVLFVPVPPLGLSVFEVAATALCYPLAVVISALVGVRSVRPADLDGFGSRT
jgi:rod shape-determining protein MreD